MSTKRSVRQPLLLIPLLMILTLYTKNSSAQNKSEKGHYVCWTGEVEGKSDRIAYYSKDRDGCSKGEVQLVYERFIRKAGTRDLYELIFQVTA